MISPKRLAIVGASARAAAESAVAAGYEVIAADLFADADLSALCPATRIEPYPAGLVDWLAGQRVDAWLYTGAIENSPELVDQMSRIAPLLGPDASALRGVREPRRLQEGLDGSGVHFPETRLHDGAIPPAGDWLVKTYRHASGMGVWELGDEPHTDSVEGQTFLQRRISGRNLAAVFAIGRDSSDLLGVTEQQIGNHELNSPKWGYCGSVGPIDLGAELTETLESLGEALRLRFGLRGLVGADLMVDSDRVWVLEVNPRYTASVEVLERALGRSAIGAHVACFTGDPIEPWPSQTVSTHAKSILFAWRDATVSESFHRWAMRLQAEGGVSDVPHTGTRIPSGAPVVTLHGMTGDAISRRIADGERLLYA